ncbi:MAG: hypothetical protein ACW98U_00060 [Candidatus Thorarchaeota archaeon]|jgi:hypothetical protein
MRKLEIVTPKVNYVPGDEISGFIELESDSPFDAIVTAIEFVGQLYAKGTRTKYRDGPRPFRGTQKKVTGDTKKVLIAEKITLAEYARYEEGEKRINFSFVLPQSDFKLGVNNYTVLGQLYPSYQGQSAWIKYVLRAKIDIYGGDTISTEIPITISYPVGNLSKTPFSESLYDQGQCILDIKSNSNLYCIGSPYELSYRIPRGKKIDKMWFEITQTEFTNIYDPQEYKDKNSQVLAKTFVLPEEVNPFDWKTTVIPSSRGSVQPIFKSNIVSVFVYLTVTIETSRGKRESGLIPLLSVDCPKKLKPILKKKPATGGNVCPHCDSELSLNGLIRPDGLVICPTCFKKFKPGEK